MQTAQVLALSGVLWCGCFEAPVPDDEANMVRIGALLPFTGELAVAGANIEKALLWQVEQVNAAGGVAGRKVKLMTRDSTSTVELGVEAARELIERRKVVALIGPQSEDLMRAVLPLVVEHQTLQIVGGAASVFFTQAETQGFWFRTIPSALQLGSVLAKRVYDDGHRRVAVLYMNNEAGRGFATMLGRELDAHGDGGVATLVPFELNVGSHLGVLTQVAGSDADAMVLIAYPGSGATLVQEWTNLKASQRVYFGHELFTNVFIENVPPGSVANAVGVTPAIPPIDGPVFTAAYRER